jgi:hypothetical protein
MSTIRNCVMRHRFALLLVLLNFISRLYRLDFTIYGRWNSRYTQTAFGIQSLADHNFNPLAVELPVVGPPWRVPMEFPVFQLLAAVPVRLFGLDVAFAGRLTASVMFCLCALAIYALVIFFTSTSHALATLVIFLFTAFGMNWGSQVLIDFTSAGLCLAGLVVVMRGITRRSNTLATLGMVIASLGSLTKVTTALPLVIGLGCLLAWTHRAVARWRRWMLLFASLPMVPVTIWMFVIDATKTTNRFANDFSIRSHLTRGAVFRPLRDAIEPAAWSSWAVQSFEPVAGSLVVLTVVLFVALHSSRTRIIGLMTLVALVAGPLALNGFYLQHEYYLIAIYPILSAAVGAGLVEIVARIMHTDWGWKGWGRHAVGTALVIAVALSWLSPTGVRNLEELLIRQQSIMPDVSDLLTSTQADDYVISIQRDTTPTRFYASGRRGVILTPGGPRLTLEEIRSTYRFVYWPTGDSPPYWAYDAPTADDLADYLPEGVWLERVNGGVFRIRFVP